MMINPGSDRPQGPWDPNAKPEWDRENAVTMMMVLLPMLLVIAAVVAWG